jgi:SagB-type dehydrogenase family enzyme
LSAVDYHRATNHTVASVRADTWRLDLGDFPAMFKEYRGVEEVAVPPPLERVLRLGAGVTRAIRTRGGAHWFRTYSSAGALYPVELYVATADGLFHYHPREHVLRRLRLEDVRANLADGEAVLVQTGILWRTAWKYQARGYRHLWWDAGTMLANVLAVARQEGVDARIVTGFVDADVDRVVGIDGRVERSLVVTALGRAAASPAPAELEPLELEVEPMWRRSVAFPEADGFHEASSLRTTHEVETYRRARPSGTVPLADGDADSYATPLESLVRRRGSVREFADAPVDAEALRRLLVRAAAPIPLDVAPACELRLVVNGVAGVEPGAYAFDSGLRPIESGDFRADATHLLLGQDFGADAAVVVFVTADVRSIGDRGYRAAQLEAGIRAGRLYLGAFDAGLGATGSTFYDDDVSEFFGEPHLSPMLAVAIGARARSRRTR